MVEVDYVLGGAILILTFLMTFFATKFWINVARGAGLVGKDMNKYYKREVAESGGIAVVFGFIVSMLMLVFAKTFLIFTGTHLVEILAITVSITLAGFLGFVDDILGWKKGLRQWMKPLLTIPIAIPIMVIMIPDTSILTIELGIFYSLLLVPIAIIGASNGFNMLAGLNGLETGMGAIIIGFLGLLSALTGQMWLAFVAAGMVVSLAAFWLFNKYPAKVFPGDSLTYSVGAMVAILAIFGGFEIIAAILFIPYFIEFLIKAKRRFKSECFGIPQKDGRLKPPERIGSLTHLLMRYGKTESGTVKLFYLYMLVLAGLSFILTSAVLSYI